jgi:NAD(P)-dependent dehydrogenase (short-subunit alcohol dehydrogenase family)
MADLSGKIAVVTGASRGVGRGIAEGLAEAAATIYLTGRTGSEEDPPDDGSVHDTALRVDELGGRGIPVVVDHEDDAAVERLFKRIEAESGRLDLLVNNAYRIPDPPAWQGAFWEHPISIWDDQCGVGLRGSYVASAYAARLMVERSSGLIVNISSRGGLEYLFSTAYGVSKAGVDRMARDMAQELIGHGVAALSLAPGAVRTEFVREALGKGAVELDVNALQSPRFIGRCIAALAMDPDILEKTGGRFRVEDLAKEYRFTDPGEDT